MFKKGYFMKRIFVFLLSLYYICFTFSLPLLVSAQASGDGLIFDSYKHGKSYAMDSYQSVKPLDRVPHTFEAWIYADKSNWTYGSILGNDSPNAKWGGKFSFALNEYFYPKLTFKDRNGADHYAVFYKTIVPSATWTHLVIVFDEDAKQFRCYINGALTETIALSATCPKKCKANSLHDERLVAPQAWHHISHDPTESIYKLALGKAVPQCAHHLSVLHPQQ